MPRLGLYLARLPGFDKRGLDREEMLTLVRAADALGYDSFWMPEAWERDAFSTLAELAVHTERIALATGIVNVFSRSPALIAMSAATVDEISGGRFRLGLGTSGARVVEDLHGVRFEKPVTRLRESIRIIRSLLEGGRADFDGECFKLSRFKLGFKPLRSEIPIYIAALGPRSLKQLGELADGWLPTLWPLTRLKDGVSVIRESAEAAGRSLDSIDIAPFVNVVVDDRMERARDRARLPIAYYVGGMGDYYHASLARLGFSAEAERIRQSWRDGRVKDARAAVTDALVDAVTVCGPLDLCRERLEELAAGDAIHPLIPLPLDGSLTDRLRLLEALNA